MFNLKSEAVRDISIVVDDELVLITPLLVEVLLLLGCQGSETARSVFH